MPAEAVAETPLAASAFTKFFFEQVNEAYAHGDSSRVLRLSAPQCNSCKSIAEDVDRLSRAGLKVPGRRFVLDYAEAAPPDNPGSIFVDFRFSSDPYVEHAASGAAATSAPAAEGQVGQARLIRSGPGWLMSGLRLVSS